MNIWRIILGAGLPFLLGSCQTFEQARSFVRTDTMRAYVQNQPLDITLVAEQAGPALERYLGNLKRFLNRSLGLDQLPITYSGETLVEAEIKPHLRLRARDFSLHDLPVQELEIHTPTVRLSVSRLFSERSFRFVSQSRFPTRITVEAQGLAHYIRTQQPQLQDFSLQLRRNHLTLDMTYPFLGVPLPIRMEGRLALRDKTQIHFVEPQVTVQGQRLADPAAEAIVNQFNPLFDGARDLRLPVGLELKKIETGDEGLVLHGDLVLSGRIPRKVRSS